MSTTTELRPHCLEADGSVRLRQGLVTGRLVAVMRDGQVPLVRVRSGGGHAVVRARSVVDLHGAHIGRSVVLAFEDDDAAQPVILGVLQGDAGWPLDVRPDQVEVDADGQRLQVTARHQLVLRCGLASITLKAGGEVLIEGTYVLSRSFGANQIQGGSVDLN